MIEQSVLMELYQQSCEIDIKAFKPGNVSIYSAGHDMDVSDFRKSYQVSAEPICDPSLSLGEKIYYAVEATRNAVGCNTNLGIVLLCAPLIHAAQHADCNNSLRDSLKNRLSLTTLQDADWMYRAISLASPGGLGSSEQEDVSQKARVTLTEAMRIAMLHDKIAELMATNYRDIFDYSILMYNSGFKRFEASDWAALSVFLGLLSRFPDSHIERKYGEKFTPWVKAEAVRLLAFFNSSNDTDSLIPILHEVDQAFKAKGINPGTSADITVATVLTVFMEQILMM